MIQLKQQQWKDGVWQFAFTIRQGVYAFDRYPVRITHAPATTDPAIAAALATVVRATLAARMASGSLAPHGEVLHWTRVLAQCEVTAAVRDSAVRQACALASARLPVSATPIVSNHF